MSSLRQFAYASLVIGSVMLLVIGTWAGRFFPDPVGPIFARIFHICTTPIIMEITFGALGIVIVVALAHYHEKHANEWVEMDIPDDLTQPPKE